MKKLALMLCAVLALFTACEKNAEFALSNDTVVLNVGDEFQVKATLGDAEVTAEWTTADAAVATVEAGLIKAVAVGETNVTATYEGQTASVKVVVEALVEDQPTLEAPGAGKVTIDKLTVLKEASIDGGAGEVNISNSSINNLDLDIASKIFLIISALLYFQNHIPVSAADAVLQLAGGVDAPGNGGQSVIGIVCQRDLTGGSAMLRLGKGQINAIHYRQTHIIGLHDLSVLGSDHHRLDLLTVHIEYRIFGKFTALLGNDHIGQHIATVFVGHGYGFSGIHGDPDRLHNSHPDGRWRQASPYPRTSA